MLNETMGRVVWIAVGLVGLGLTITLLWGIFSTNIKEVENKNPTVPSTLGFQYEMNVKDIV
jgi:hypothetical protein